jgi:hypothetical protein
MYKTHVFLTLSLVAGEWSASRSGRFTALERTHLTHRIGGWVGPRASLNDMEKLKFSTLSGLELQSLGRPVTIPDCISTELEYFS